MLPTTDQDVRLAGAWWTGARWMTLTWVITADQQHLIFANEELVPVPRDHGRLLVITPDRELARRIADEAVSDGFQQLSGDRPVQQSRRRILVEAALCRPCAVWAARARDERVDPRSAETALRSRALVRAGCA